MKGSPTLTVPQVARILGIYIPHAQQLLRLGKIKGWKTAKGWRTTQESVGGREREKEEGYQNVSRGEINASRAIGPN